ncbi:hypothetical protein PFISCL1PPCAC_28286, partial [Pristionchus fissidentatus]
RRRNGVREKDAPSAPSTPKSKQTEKEAVCERRRLKERAVLIRKHTLEQIKKQNEDLLATTRRMLFDAVIIVSVERVRQVDGSFKQRPVVSFVYGQISSDPECKSITPSILYPDAGHASPIRKGHTIEEVEQSFFVALTDEKGMRTFAYCIKFEAPAANFEQVAFPQVFAVITRVRDPTFYFELAKKSITFVGETNRLKSFLRVVIEKEHPRRGGILIVEQKNEDGSACKRTEICSFGCEPRLKLDWSSNELVRKLAPEWTTCVIAALLAQQRVLITGSSVHEVTCTVHAIDALLRPFEWPFCFIPCLPDNLVELCDNPSPYLVGMLRHNLDQIQHMVVEELDETLVGFDKMQSEFAMFDIDRGMINPIPITIKTLQQFEDNDQHFKSDKERETHLRAKNCITYCKRVGMPRKVAKSLMSHFTKALNKEKAHADVETCTEAMLHWYASLFGHYKSSGALSQWDRNIKATLVDKQHNVCRKEYLEFLVESAMFDLWIRRKVTDQLSYNLAKLLGESQRSMVLFMQSVLACLEITSISHETPGFLRFLKPNTFDRLPGTSDDLAAIDTIFEHIADAQNFKRKKPVKHAFGKIFGSGRK